MGEGNLNQNGLTPKVESEAINRLGGNLHNESDIFDLFLATDTQMYSFRDTDQLIAFFVNKVAETFKAGRVSFLFLDQTKEELFIKTAHGMESLMKNTRIKLGQMFDGWVAQRGRSLLVKDVEAEFPDIFKNRLLRYKTKSFIIVPIEKKEGVIGVLNLTDRKAPDIFNEDDLRITNFLCHCLALHMENIELLNTNTELVTVDGLTGLFNHRYFQEQLLEEIYQAERYRHPLSLLLLDIDNFSSYNQTYGYSAGDSALKQIGKIIKENTRLVDVAVRYGPEEFMILLPNTRLKQALVVGERIKDAINFSVFTEDRTSSYAMARLTASIGVVEHVIGLDKQELISRAEEALLEAKQRGKNYVCAFKSK